jgi:hypothetical protein
MPHLFVVTCPCSEVIHHALMICLMTIDVYAQYSLLGTFILHVTVASDYFPVSKGFLIVLSLFNEHGKIQRKCFHITVMFVNQNYCLLWCPRYQPMKSINNMCVALGPKMHVK